MRKLLLGIVLFAVMAVSAATTPDVLQNVMRPCAFTNVAGEVLLYRANAPVPTARKVPLVLFLHGAGERGADNAAQLKHAVGPILDYFLQRGESVHVLAPQCPNERRWVETDWSAPAHNMADAPSKSLRLALQLVEQTMRQVHIDPARVYVAGISMGGYGTWDAVCRRPDLFAGAMPVCGGGDTHQAWKVRTLPLLVVHGAADTAVPTSRSRDMVAALRALDAPVRYVEYPLCGHNCWSAAFADRALLDWLFAQRKLNAFPREDYLKPRIDEPGAWEVAVEGLSPAAYLERVRAVGFALHQAHPQSYPVCRRDGVTEAFAKALDAFGEGEEYAWRTKPDAHKALKGTLSGPLLCAGYGRAYLLDVTGAEIASWNGCGNIHRVWATPDYIWWSNGRVWRVPRAGGTPECVYRAANEVGGGVLGFTVEGDGSVVMAVNSTREVIELAPPRTFPPHAPFTVRTRFKVDARDAKGVEPGAHGALRMIRKTAQGTYLVCLASAAKVVEYDRQGKVLWQQACPPFTFDCLRRANGNTLISHLDGVSEFSRDHQKVWQVACSDFPALKLNYLCGLQELPNGNLVIGTWSNGSPDRARTTCFEITRDKKLIWAHQALDANTMTAERID